LATLQYNMFFMVSRG